MGTSKAIMLSGVYVILGFYTISFNRVNETNFTNAVSVTSVNQAEHLAQTGLSLAQTYMGNNAVLYYFPARSLTTMGGTVTYNAERPASFPTTQTQVTATGMYNGKQVVMTAVFHYYGGRWKLLRVYTNTV
ncbi:MAG: hypothetical protein AB1600_08855 [Bacteroidota bacterium]